MLGVAAVVSDVTKEPAEVVKEPASGFGPLKAVLGDTSAVYVDYEVRLQPPLDILVFCFDEPVRRKLSRSETGSKTSSRV